MTERNQREKWWTAATISGTWCSHMKSNENKYDRDTPDFNPIGWAPVSGERATEVILIFIFKYFFLPRKLIDLCVSLCILSTAHIACF